MWYTACIVNLNLNLNLNLLLAITPITITPSEVQDGRQDEHKCKDNGTYRSIMNECCNHKIRMEKKVTYPSGA